MMYMALVRSRIDYACFLYSHAAHSHLSKLDRVQYEAIRIIIGNMRCTPLGNLEAEAHILPLDLRRRQMALNYFGKAYRIQGHPVRELYVGYHNYEFYNHRPHNLPVVGRVRNTVIESNIPISRLEKFNMSDLYIPNKAKVRYSLLKNKSTYPEYMFKADFQELITNEYSSYVQIYTDGSKINGECGCAVFVDVDPPIIVKKRLPPTCSIFNAELYALSEALKLVQESNSNDFVIFSDSHSTLQFLDNPKMDHHIKIRIINILNSLNKNIVMEWVPGHSSIEGNCTVDIAAKQATTLNFIENLPISYGDYKSIVLQYIFRQWQMRWSLTGRCRLKKFKPILGDWKSAYRDSRKEEKVLSRLRTGSCYFVWQSHINPPGGIDFCANCNSEVTIAHLLLHCPKFRQSRIRLINYLNCKNLPFTEENLLNDQFPHGLLFLFLKETNYYKKI